MSWQCTEGPTGLYPYEEGYWDAIDDYNNRMNTSDLNNNYNDCNKSVVYIPHPLELKKKHKSSPSYNRRSYITEIIIELRKKEVCNNYVDYSAENKLLKRATQLMKYITFAGKQIYRVCLQRAFNEWNRQN